MVTAGTYRKAPLFNTRERLELMVEALFRVVLEHNWELQALGHLCKSLSFCGANGVFGKIAAVNSHLSQQDRIGNKCYG